MLKKIGTGLILATLAFGCKSTDESKDPQPCNYTNDASRAMPTQNYWWEGVSK